ncbi:MAG: hypothetical protein V3U54_13535 [Thermodesulfobacteriota bacterium]|jgi:hypothetical protein
MSFKLLEDTYDVIKERSAYKPENYEGSKDIKVETAPMEELQQIFNQRRKYQPTPIMKLQKDTRKFYTPTPISVIIYRDGDLFFAENENLVVCGTGHTRQEALQDLSLHIIHFFEYYKKLGKSKLIGDALRLKELYQNLLVEE